ncbi:Hypothetical protein C900_03629 [Fulvivirga imtechensis AK7]|uniref:Uncharacterized protein n=1 Tax=Fulvivirga imtechensis AK7 TaxID=1237149 RepID=L8JR12_9BACT|nr:DUF6506 family protein [Fulvivirga imtechensis]ELR70648.1 Hypothetical protein C900_03629 [Fulvivirga imtechensis AK7]
MTTLSRYAFIVKHKSYSSLYQRASLETDEFKTLIVGVSDTKEATEAIKQLLSEGVQVIELCGGFSEAEKDQIKQDIGGKIPLGVVKFDNEDLKKLESFTG